MGNWTYSALSMFPFFCFKQKMIPFGSLTIRKARKIHSHLKSIGLKVMDGWKRLGEKHGIAIETGGIPQLGRLAFGTPVKALAAQYLFTHKTLKRGFFATTLCYIGYVHMPTFVVRCLQATDEVFGLTAEAMRYDRLNVMVEGPICHSGFKCLSKVSACMS